MSGFLSFLKGSRLFLELHYSFIIVQAFQFSIALYFAHLLDFENFLAHHFCLFVSFAMNAECSFDLVPFPLIISACWQILPRGRPSAYHS